MMPISQILNDNIRLLKAKAARPAIYGVIIAITAIIIATGLVSQISHGEITLGSIIDAQHNNVALWALDLMPFIFAFWGQYVSSIIAYEAGAMVIDQTQDLRTRTTALEYQTMHDATHDALTDLPNRILLRDRLQQAIFNAQRNHRAVAVLLLDLNRFKDINDTLGHFQGDRVLKHVAVRLKHVMRDTDTLGRLGGDEFAIILNPLTSLYDINIVVEKIHKALVPPYSLENLKVDVQASIGAALFPENGNDADTLLQRADIAMYSAKQDKKVFVLYTEKLDQQSPTRLTLMSELRDAIKNDELTLRFQPIANSATQSINEAEVLVRWQHKIHGTMNPDEFIPLAERTGLINPLTQWVIKNALRQQATWRKLGLDIGIAINISAQTLLDPEFAEEVTGLLAAHEVLPQRLVLEITESSIMFDQELAMHILTRFADMGVRIAIDDFGTGYSSLSYLRKLPVSQLKIDKSFVLDMLNNDNDAVIVNATIDLGHNLGLEVVAEGVESEDIFKRLQQRGCDAMQGYHINYPLRGEDFLQWFYTTTHFGVFHRAEETVKVSQHGSHIPL
jgi:diguanylate cyclase (GGDEF)-like protein